MATRQNLIKLFKKNLFHFVFLFLSVIFLMPLLTDVHIVHANDLNGTDLQEIYFRDSMRVNHTFPQWNSSMQEGIPLISDPMYFAYNPIMAIPLILMPSYDGAIKLIYLISIFLAMETMYLLSKEFISSKKISFFIALTFATCGFLAARIIEGHIESIVPFGLIPFFIFSLLKVTKKKNIFWSGLLAISLSYFAFSGSIYFVLYGLFAVTGVASVSLLKEKKVTLYLCISLILFALFTSVKIFPDIELQNYLFKTTEPFLGSQTVISMIRFLFLPSDRVFDFLGLTTFISKDWGVLEKTTFIGFFPLLIILWGVKNFWKIHIPNKKFLFTLIIVFFLILMPNWDLNPYKLLIFKIHSLQFFRVPTRSYGFFSAVLLILFGVLCENLLKRNKLKKFVFPILSINLISTIIFFEVMITHPELLAYAVYPADYPTYEKIFSWLQIHNTHDSYVLMANNNNEIPEDVAYYHNQRLLNTNYGFVLKNSPAEHYGQVRRPTPYSYAYAYNDILPDYIITPRDTITDMPSYAKKVFSVNRTSIFQIPNGRPFALLESAGKTEAIHATFGVNAFRLTATTKQSGHLTLSEMKYPGWEVWIDGKKSHLINARFLTVQTAVGKHTYLFRFSSVSFQEGLWVSCISFFLWLLYCLKFFVRK